MKSAYFLYLVFILLICSSVQVVSAEGGYVYTTQWGGNGSGDGQLYHPYGIAVDSVGNVYVADRDNNRIQKFTSNGTFITKWGGYGSEDGQFINPQGVAVDNVGDVYVTDSGNYRVQKFTSSGVFITKWGGYGSEDGQFNSPVGIAVDNVGDVYVTDSDPNPDPYSGTGNHRVQKFTSNGTFLLKWGSEGTGDGHFRAVNGVTVDSAGDVYVTDYYAKGINQDRVQKFTSNGTFLLKWGNDGMGIMQFYRPSGIVVDSAGNVYVADLRHHAIKKFDSSGNLIITWGREGSGEGQFLDPWDVAVDSSGNVYVADTWNYRIQKFSPASSSTSLNASFTATPTTGSAHLRVLFTDTSTGGPTSWFWDFGDGFFSTKQNTDHLYTAAGSYNPSLTVTNGTQTSTTRTPITVTTARVITPVPPSGDAPLDLNDDGLYEDVNGNGLLDFNDVVLFFNQMDWIASNEPISAFDFNHNGTIDFNDIVTLSREL